MLSELDQLNLERIRRCLTTEDGRVLVSWINGLFQRVSTQLRTSRETVDIHRYQGKLEAYDQILRVREE